MDNKEKSNNNAEITLDLTEIKIEPEDNPVIFVSESVPQIDFGKNILSSSQIGPFSKTILVLNKKGETISTDSVISTRIVERNPNLRVKQTSQKPQNLLSIISRTTTKTIPIISSSISSGFSRHIEQTFLTFTSRCIEADGTVKTLKEYLCNFCQYKVSIIHAMERHVQTHKFVCNHCSFTSLTRIEIIKHKHDCHPGISSEELAGYEGLDNILSNKSTELVSSSLSKSSVLPNSARTQNLIANTRQIIKPTTLVDKNLMPDDGSFFTYKVVQDGAGRIKMYECYICGLRYLTTRDIIKHASTHSITEMTKLGKKGSMDMDVKWECYYCTYSDASRAEIINHIIKIHPDQRIQIKMINNKTFETNDSSISTASSTKFQPTILLDNESNSNINIASTETKLLHTDGIDSKKDNKSSDNFGRQNKTGNDSHTSSLICGDIHGGSNDNNSNELKTGPNNSIVCIQNSVKQPGYKSTLEKYIDIYADSSKTPSKSKRLCNLSDKKVPIGGENDIDIEPVTEIKSSESLQMKNTEFINTENKINSEYAVTETNNVSSKSNKSSSKPEIIGTNCDTVKSLCTDKSNDHIINKITENTKKKKVPTATLR